jgi:hypothetical protein
MSQDVAGDGDAALRRATALHEQFASSVVPISSLDAALKYRACERTEVRPCGDRLRDLQVAMTRARHDDLDDCRGGSPRGQLWTQRPEYVARIQVAVRYLLPLPAGLGVRPKDGLSVSVGQQ